MCDFTGMSLLGFFSTNYISHSLFNGVQSRLLLSFEKGHQISLLCDIFKVTSSFLLRLKVGLLRELKSWWVLPLLNVLLCLVAKLHHWIRICKWLSLLC